MAKLIFGCGYLGRCVARRWLAEGERVVAVTRTTEHATALAGEGLEPLVADVTQPDSLTSLPVADTVLYAIGYEPGGGTSRRHVAIDGLRAVLDALPSATGRILYISSTAVYGNVDGEWVDEQTPCRPDHENGQLVLEAENVLRAHPLGARAVVLRLAGLYGPGRLPKIHDLVAGRPLSVLPEAVVNLIHVEDAASVILATERKAQPPSTYVVADGQPVLRRDFYRYLGQLLHAPTPLFVEPDPNSPSSRGAGSKRVSNARMHAELDVRLAYPSYREGLAAIVDQGDWPWRG